MGSLSPAELQYQEAHKDETIQPNFIASLVICTVLAYTAVALRLVARRRQRAHLGADDWWIIGALIPSTTWVGLNFWSIHEGLGLHQIRITDVKDLVLSAISCEILYGLCLPPVKLSILCLYHRIFPSRTLYRTAIGIGLVVIGAAISGTVSWGLQCIPLSKAWTGGPGHCVDVSTLATTLAIINIVTDVTVLTLPIPSLLRLQVSRMVKAGLIGTFGLGGCVCVFSIIRAVKVGSASQLDPSWNDAPGGIWSVIEVHVAIVSACLPTLRPLFTRRSGLQSHQTAASDASRKRIVRGADSELQLETWSAGARSVAYNGKELPTTERSGSKITVTTDFGYHTNL